MTKNIFSTQITQLTFFLQGDYNLKNHPLQNNKWNRNKVS